MIVVVILKNRERQKQVMFCPLCYQSTQRGGRKKNIKIENMIWHESCYLFSQGEDISKESLEGILKRYVISKRTQKIYNEALEAALITWNSEHKKIRRI